MDPLLAPVFFVAPAYSEHRYAASAEPGGPRGDSGVDLYFPEAVVVPPGAVPTLIDLKVKVRLAAPGGQYAPYLLMPCSRIGKTPLGLANSVGLIDQGYVGSLIVAVRNYGHEPVALPAGSALFQVVAPNLAPPRVAVVAEGSPAFGATLRGAGSFGSTQ